MLTFEDIFHLALKSALKHDPRPRKEIDFYLGQAKRDYEKLDAKKREFFDSERMSNPYPDSRILFSLPGKGKKVREVLVGIDIDTEDFLVARELNREGAKIDGIITHHPSGLGRVALPHNMHLQTGIAYDLGVPVNIAEKLLEPRFKEVERKISPINNNRAVDTARLFNIPFMSIHTMADNHVHSFVARILKKKNPLSVGDVLDCLFDIPEFKEAAKLGMGPEIYAGTSRSRAGKIAVTGMTGGTEGPLDIYERYSRAGVGTIVEMHISDERLEQAKKHHLNVVMSGHMASDSLGMNLIMDQIERKGTKVVACSGFIRVKR